jgi:hypothetical protein
MNPLLVRLAFRLSVPLLSVIGMWAMGEPLPRAADAADSKVIALAEAAVQIAPQFSGEIEQARAEMQEGAAELRRAAANMRWLVTLPAARSRRCNAADCAG